MRNRNPKPLVKTVKRCRICKSRKLYKFLDLGSMPIPNGFLKKEELGKEEGKYELACFFCEECGLVQTTVVVTPEIMFKNYVYIPSTSKVMMNNFSSLAYQSLERVKYNDNTLVVDIGSNDGSLLTFFKAFGVRVVGIDPAENLARLAEMKGVPTETLLFGTTAAKKVVKKYGKAKIITATNVMAHIDNLHKVIEGISGLLDDDGYFITEFPYLLDLIHHNEFDTIYHEHLSYFSLKPWKKLVEQYGFNVVDVQRMQIHGGSIRITQAKKRSPRSTALSHLLSLEEHYGLYKKSTYGEFAAKVENLKAELTNTLNGLKKQGRRIVGYGAAAKGNVLTNCFNLGTETLDYIVDSTPYKQGLYTPGKHIPVYAESKLLEDMPDYALILAWNFADEIIEKQQEYKRRGGNFIIPVPEVRIA